MQNQIEETESTEIMEKSQIKKQSLTYLFFKRLTDSVLSLLALIGFSPVFLGVWIANRFGDNKGPLFFKQTRIGKNGKPFKMYKFRSMIVNADEILHSNIELYEKYVENNYKLEPDEDPRITKLGRWLRRTSIDEIPQFINILKGDMSIVGPRPVVKEELKEYGDRVDKFLSVKPGAMGLWQASGRSNIGYPERCDLELSYVDHASYWYDVKIMFKNIISIFKNTGAY
ncbi:UDP-glucose:undecaprenyl-phosphate glucose-1-phosphate transferase [Limosilactobacillus mucosae]|uniref:UDP-glucose:undecaprenyl-phosphate glucose-1-phosphate transferase n=1 Tax=Limosilactobacillus mucosae TaxID=97478 RepID=A0A508YQQ6_LIMMU|nr:UDP-glucose:undecaprenyl-phosphate glucose-1-phosphate transferase [Limosilactobacillus mucosae]